MIKHKIKKSVVRNVFIVLSLLLVNIAAIKISRVYESQLLINEVNAQLKFITMTIEDNLRENSYALKRMGNRWSTSNGTSEPIWRSDAKSYSRDLLGVVGTGYADSNSKIKWIEPQETNSAAVDFVLNSEREKVIVKAIETQEPQMTKPIILLQGGLGHLVLYPVKNKGKVDGYVYLVTRYSDYFPKLFRNKDFIYLVKSESENIYQSANIIPAATKTFTVFSKSPVQYTANWRIEVLPTTKKIASYYWKITRWTLFGTLLFSVIISLCIWLLEKSNRLAKVSKEQDGWKNAILNSTELAVISTDVTGVVISFNQAAEKLLGYNSSEVVGFQTPALWHDAHEVMDRANALSAEFNQNVSPGFDVFTYKVNVGFVEKNIWTVITKTGIRKQVFLSVNQVKDNDLNLMGYVGIIELVSDQATLKEQIFSKEKAINDLIENSFDGFWDWDIKNDYQYMSPSFWKMFGYDPKEKRHHPNEWKKIISTEGLKTTLENYKMHVETKGEHPYHQEVSYTHKDGHIVWVICKGKVTDWSKEGKPLRMIGTHTDITEIKKKNERIEKAKKEILERDAKILDLKGKSEDWFRVITDSLPQLMWTCTVSGPCDFLSEQWVKYTGIPEAEQFGFEWLKQIHPNDQERVIREWQLNVVKETNFSIKFRIRRHDGVYHWFDTMAIPIKNAEGEIIRWLGSNTDIQEIYSVQENLERKEKLLQDAQGLAKTGSWELDLETQEVTWSKQMFLNFNFPFAEKAPDLGEIEKIFVPEFPEKWHYQLERCKSDGTPYSGQLIVKSIEGTKWLKARGEAVSKNGKIVGLRGTCQDITEEVNATSEIEIVKTRLEMALEGANIGIWEWDVVNNIIRWDDQMFLIYGQKREAFTSAYEAWTKGLHPDDRAQAEASISAALNNAQPFNTQFRVIKDNGEIGYVVGKAKVIFDETGKPQKMIGINWDITKIKLNELELEKAKVEAMQSSIAKAQFLANMSHEIRTPLNGIIGMSNLLKGTELNDQQHEYLEHVTQSSSILLSLVNDILDLSKIDSGKIDLESIDFNLEQTIDYVVSSLSFSAKNKNLIISSDYQPPTPNWLKSDPSRIKQVLLNLVSNAIKFTSEGSVTLKTKILSRSNEKLGFRVEVIDTGIGVSHNQQSKLFQNFMQADASTHRKFGGTGLGLAISKLLVEKLGGKIGLISEVDKGSTFWFELELPIGSEKLISDDLNESLVRNIDRTSVRILVAEDNIVNQKVAEATLKKLGYECQIVANGFEVLKILETFHFNLILMDCQMPEMDGFEASEKIRSSDRPEIKNIPIIAMTANVMAGDKERCLNVGMNDYISKPVSAKDLAKTIEKWI